MSQTSRLATPFNKQKLPSAKYRMLGRMLKSFRTREDILSSQFRRSPSGSPPQHGDTKRQSLAGKSFSRKVSTVVSPSNLSASEDPPARWLLITAHPEEHCNIPTSQALRSSSRWLSLVLNPFRLVIQINSNAEEFCSEKPHRSRVPGA